MLYHKNDHCLYIFSIYFSNNLLAIPVFRLSNITEFVGISSGIVKVPLSFSSSVYLCISLFSTNKCFKLTLFPERIIAQIFIRMVELTSACLIASDRLDPFHFQVRREYRKFFRANAGKKIYDFTIQRIVSLLIIDLHLLSAFIEIFVFKHTFGVNTFIYRCRSTSMV